MQMCRGAESECLPQPELSLATKPSQELKGILLKELFLFGTFQLSYVIMKFTLLDKYLNLLIKSGRLHRISMAPCDSPVLWLGD